MSQRTDFHNSINNIKYLKDLTNDSYSSSFLDNSFCVFTSIDFIIYLIYSNKIKSIISYDICNNKKLSEIKNAHLNYISNFRHYFDKVNKRDLIISISSKDNNIKLWNINNLECLFNFIKVNNIGRLISACFLNNNNIIYILTSNSNHPDDADNIKVFDIYGNKIKELKDSNENTFFIDTYYDIKLSKNYIITGNYGYIKSYDYNEEKIYYKYDENDNRRHYSIVINNNKEIVELIDSSCSGYIRIWNFNSGKLLKKINVDNNMIYSICLWNNENIFIGCMDNSIKLIDIQNEVIIKELSGYNDMVICVKKIFHFIYGECLISQALGKEQIKIWGI